MAAIVKLLPVYVVPFVTQKDGYEDGRRPLKGRIGIDNYYREIHLLFSLLQEATNKTSFSKWVLGGGIRGYSLTTARTRSNVVH
jgi:hypothetical protein